MLRTTLLALLLSGCGNDAASSVDACAHDCAGVCNGSASLDRCGVCDTDPSNDCWKGIHGTTTVPALPMNGSIGTDRVSYSEGSVAAQYGYFYSGPAFTDPPLAIARTTTPNTCDPAGLPGVPGYSGFTSLTDIVDASTLNYDSRDQGIVVGTEQSACFSGLLAYLQGGRYGAIRFIRIGADGIELEYWLGDEDVTNFRNAP